MAVTSEYKVDRNLWESLECTFQIHGRNYVREFAKRLRVDEKELVRKVFGSDSKIRVTMIDSGSESSCCQAYVKSGLIVHYCRKPVCIGSSYCSIHNIMRSNVIEKTGVTSIRKLADAPDRETLWVKENGDVIGIDGNYRGKYSEETGKLTLFVVNDE